MLGKLLLAIIVALVVIHGSVTEASPVYCEDGSDPPEPFVFCVKDTDCAGDEYCFIDPNYAVCCPDDTALALAPDDDCPSWTNWFDLDDPDTGGGDIESIVSIRAAMPKQVCEDPTLIDYRIKDLLKRLITPEEIVVFNLPFTMLCLNADQPDGKCEDYEVRFCCPDVVPECPEGCSWTEWFDEDDPDDGVDFESIDKVLENNGPDAACPNPKASQARVVATEVDSSLSGQSVTLSRDSKSFLCLNGFQAGTEKCYDYEIRFCCPDKPGEDESPSDETPSDETPPGPRRNCPFDVVVVIDLSSSIPFSEFLRILHFLIQLIRCFDGMDVRTGVITYACLPYFDIPLGEHSLDDLLDAVQQLERRGGRSRTGQALHYVKCMTDFREQVCPVTVVMSDGSGGNGQGTDDYVAQAAMLRDSGIELYAVAFGYPFWVNTAALGTITGNPDRVFSSTNPCDLANRIIEECCEEN